MTSRDNRWYRWQGDELTLALRVQPRAARDEFVAAHERLGRNRPTTGNESR